MTLDRPSGPAPRTRHFGSGGFDPYEVALTASHPGLRLVPAGGGPDSRLHAHIDVARFLARADRVDRRILRLTRGSVLDVGSGPGRMVREATRRGRRSLGIDVSPAAVEIARRADLPVIKRSVFEAVPDAGRWDAVLLLDGNIGIGGDPAALLARCAELGATAGAVLVEAHRDVGSDALFEAVVLHPEGGRSDAFPWAHVGADAVARYAAQAGLVVRSRVRRGGRTFLVLARPPNGSDRSDRSDRPVPLSRLLLRRGR
ncbi:MAG: methyltransferase domain-containing protein [Terracoccus sp.]